MDAVSGWIGNPEGLLLLAGLPLLAVLALWAWLLRRRGWRMLGKAPAGSAQRLWRFVLLGAGLLLTGISVARPFWGREDTAVSGAARDLVVVLDVSRSMLAESPSRQMRAQRVLVDLAVTLKQRGGHRIALIATAGKAQLVMPLTTDYDLFHYAVMAQDAAKLPVELQPEKDGTGSGTRLGAGMHQAVAAHDADPVYRGSQIIMLISDGDDPADDGEWKSGIVAARRASIPVFVIGVGDSERASRIRFGEKVLTFGDAPVESKMNEGLLKEIAQQSDGTYFPVRNDSVASGTLLQAILEAASARPRETLPAQDVHQRFRWFLLPGMLLLGATLLIPDRKIIYHPRRWTGQNERWAEHSENETMNSTRKQTTGRAGPTVRTAPAALGLALMAILFIAAAPPLDDYLRHGNEAFQRKDYAAALEFYDKAEELAADPGLVAFNKGATLSRLGRPREAELCYLRCLQDGDVSAERRLKARYDLGMILLQRGAERKDLEALVRAGECFDLCGKDPRGDTAMRDDAEHNLELTRWIFQRVRAELMLANEKAPFPRDPPGGAKSQSGKDDTGPGNPKGKDPIQDQGEPGKQSDAQTTDDKLVGSGHTRTLPDTDRLQTLDPNDARELLARTIQRIERDREQSLGPVNLENRNVKDW